MDLVGAHDALDRPVATLDQYLGLDALDERQRRVVLDPGDALDRLERRDHGEAVRQRVDRAIGILAEAPDRCVAVDRHHETGAQRPGFGEIGDVAPVQYVEDPVGEHEGAWQVGEQGADMQRVDDLALEGYEGAGHGRVGCIGPVCHRVSRRCLSCEAPTPRHGAWPCLRQRTNRLRTPLWPWTRPPEISPLAKKPKTGISPRLWRNT